jgi:ketosteroid isomerase-like protein
MSIEANKDLVRRYFEAQSSGDLHKGLSLLAEDVVWWVPGEWEMAGTFDKAGMKKVMDGLSNFEGGLKFTFHSMTAEEDRVATMTYLEGKLKDGRTYTNHIFWQFTIANGKISRVIECPDSLQSARLWLGVK